MRIPYLITLAWILIPLGVSLTATSPQDEKALVSARDEARGSDSRIEGRLDAPTAMDRPSYEWQDVDGDGQKEAIVRGAYGGQRVFRQVGDAQFEEVTAEWRLDELFAARFAIWADFDQDGRIDVYLVTRDGEGRLYHHTDQGFEDVTLGSGLEGLGTIWSAQWLPLDDDPLPDLQVESEGGTRVFQSKGSAGFVPVPLPKPAPEDFPQPGPRGVPGSRGLSPSVPAFAGPLGGSRDLSFPGGPSSASGPTPSPGPPGLPLGNPPAPFSFCASGVEDLANPGTCLSASTTPGLGLLYPLSSDFYVDPSGRVGLGTTNPLHDLDVLDGQAVVRLSSTGSANGSVLELHSSVGSPTFYGAINFLKSNNSLASQVGGLADGTLLFRAGSTGTEKLRLDSGGMTVTGDVVATNQSLTLGDGNVLGQFSIGSSFGNETDRLNILSGGSQGGANGISFVSSSFPTIEAMSIGHDATPSGNSLDAIRFYDTSRNAILSMENRGFVGLKASPAHRLHVANPNEPGVGSAAVLGLDQAATGPIISAKSPGAATANFKVENDGRVYAKSSTGSGVSSPTVYAENTATGQGIGVWSRTWGTDSNLVLDQWGSGDIARGFTAGSLKFRVTNTGRVVTTALQITGGGDLVEGFETGEETCEPGSVLVIDPENPGELRLSGEAYDPKVAGVVSGAGGVAHGIRMGQDGVLDGDTLVAMTGRVYVKCSAENGPIRPGDRLTTCSLPGHAMKATDSARSDGAVLGKAMTSLESGTGLVLVLVNLQ